MSTKTTFKRIALVAVASLGFGVLTSVSPANATFAISELAAEAGTGVLPTTSISLSQTTAGRLNAPVIIKATIAATPDGTDEVSVIGARFSGAVPSGSALTGDSIAVYANNNSTVTGVQGATAGDLYAPRVVATVAQTEKSGAEVLDLDATDSDATNDGYNAFAIDFGAVTATASTATVYLKFTPDKVGTYNFQLWNDADLGEDVDAAEGTKTLSVVVTDQAISTVTVTAASSAPLSDDSLTGATLDGVNTLVRIQLKNSAGTPVQPQATETIALAVNGTGFFDDINMANAVFGSDVTGSPTAITLTASNFDQLGRAWVEVGNASAATVTVTASVDGGTATGSGAVTTTASNGDLADEYRANSATPSGYVMATDDVTVSSAASSISLIGETASLELKTASLVVDTDGAITGLPGAKYLVALTAGAINNTLITAPAVSITLSPTWEFIGQTFTVTGDSQSAQTFTSALSAVSASLTLFNVDSISSVTGGLVTVRVTAKDQFGSAKAGLLAAFSVAGRNTVLTGTNVITDADGNAVFSYTDAGTSGSDTISVVINSVSITDTVAVTFDAANAVSTVEVTSGDTTDGVANLSVAYKDILAGKAGPTTSAYDVTATVKNAAGNALVGVAVTWTVAGTGCAIPSNEVTTYTSSTGVATSAVYAWLAGKCTVTATAGGKTGTGVTSFRQESTSEIRTLSGSVSGQVVTAAPKDRFGNPVKGGTVYAVITAGNGYFGSNGTRIATLTTDASGTATVVVAGGDATVKLTTIDPTGTGLATDQSTAAAGNVAGDVETPVAFTATTVGTATTAETGVGATFAPAGISSVTLEVAGDSSASAAADAAAEATDAANAATDAANAAAEAADAATAAAQDAADAVAALSTQVSEMVNALKKQITALTNLVIKIQKKVKA